MESDRLVPKISRKFLMRNVETVLLNMKGLEANRLMTKNQLQEERNYQKRAILIFDADSYSGKENYVEAIQIFDRDGLLQCLLNDPFDQEVYMIHVVVHHVSTDRGHDIFMLVEKDYPLTRGVLTLMLCNKLQVDQYSEMAQIKFSKDNLLTS
ncbi:hypothetical protein Tco_0720396 [Tanacetum coccineum]